MGYRKTFGDFENMDFLMRDNNFCCMLWHFNLHALLLPSFSQFRCLHKFQTNPFHFLRFFCLVYVFYFVLRVNIHFIGIHLQVCISPSLVCVHLSLGVLVLRFFPSYLCNVIFLKFVYKLAILSTSCVRILSSFFPLISFTNPPCDLHVSSIFVLIFNFIYINVFYLFIEPVSTGTSHSHKRRSVFVRELVIKKLKLKIQKYDFNNLIQFVS